MKNAQRAAEFWVVDWDLTAAPGSSRVVCVFAAFTKTMSLVGGFGGFGNFGTPVAQPAFGGCTGGLLK